ncbi:MAG: hypothetical protein KBS45_05675 [Clostridiales bacterium]|nr:hypothetical protein [Candidatus Coliplasma caballi]
MKRNLEKLKVYANEFMNNGNSDFDPDKLYTYAVAVRNGEIEEDRKNVDYILRSILYFFCRGENFADVIEKYPLTLPYLSDVASGIGTQVLYDFACYYRDELGNDEKFFEVVDLGEHTYPKGLSGGMGLVNQLIYNDLCRLELARCYKDGVGVEKDYPIALRHYLRYRTDHLCQKWAEDELTEEELADLYAKMKSESDAEVNYPGLHFALAVMSAEGFGTPYDVSAYRKYYEKEMENYENGANDDSEYRELMEDYDSNVSASFSQVKEPNEKDIKAGDVVRFGKYNHRDVIWHVLRVEEDRALLLSVDCLESNYIVHAKCGDFSTDENYEDSAVRQFTSDLDRALFPTEEDTENFADLMIPDEQNDCVFLLSKEEIEKCGLPEAVPLAGAREQAMINGYDGCGVDVDEGTGASPWWTSTDGDKEGRLVFVNGIGEFEEAPMQMEGIGIRPAVWLKLKK